VANNSLDQGVTNLRAYQGDSHKQEELTDEKFDLIFGCNLIDRLHTPSQWVQQSKVQGCRDGEEEDVCVAGHVEGGRVVSDLLPLHLEAGVHPPGPVVGGVYQGELKHCKI